MEDIGRKLAHPKSGIYSYTAPNIAAVPIDYEYCIAIAICVAEGLLTQVASEHTIASYILHVSKLVITCACSN